jgi:hypothetical protein
MDILLKRGSLLYMDNAALMENKQVKIERGCPI